MSLIDWIQDNSRMVFVAVAGYVAAADFGYVTPIWEMEGSMIVGTAAVVAGIAGFAAAGKIQSLLPDEEGIYIVAFESSDDTGGAIYEISEDQFDAMEVAYGSLFEWPVGKRVYECKEYRPEENVAVGNWRESIAASQLAGDAQVVDAMDQIAELRDEFEPEARKSRHLKRRIRSIVRKLDRRRLLDQQEIIDPTTTPAFKRDDATVSQVVQEEVPDELLPESMTASETDETTNGQDPETVGFEVLDDMENEPLTRND